MKPERVTTEQVREALRLRYAAPEYALLEEVGNATGTNCRRHADALAMSLWPSRGIEVSGFEIKVSRSDWLRELANPEKADSIARFCDRWWLVAATAKIVQPGELPPTWGLLVMNGSALKCEKEAAALPAQKLSRGFVAALLRRANASATELRRQAQARGFELGRERGRADVSDPQGIAAEFGRLKNQVTEFEAKSGIKIDYWNGGQLGAAVARLTAGRTAGTTATRELDRTVEAMERALAALRAERRAINEALELAGGKR